MQLGAVPVETHEIFTGLGLGVAAAVFAVETHRRGRHDPRLWYLVAGALTGGAVFARIGTWLQHLRLGDNAGLAQQWLYGNRSILSGLLGAYAGVLVAKRLCGYTEHSGDLFAPAVAAGMAVGRIGCLLTELPGTPTGGRWGITLTAEAAARIPGARVGVPLHPSFAYEIVFHLLALGALVLLRDRVTRPDALFTGYLAGYAIFRFGVEFVRGNQVVADGLTRPQWFLLCCAPLLAWRIWKLNGRVKVR
ncbi:prolipoprotein diacylglyceryl transferase family protein [Krasilnikovia cinnamomea]|uniref:prolipoprotein diacylglyceryl transferase family protein n=1 Tax=Krasilnikovia cinnamomea TaxID=349313 RepID=UPI00102B61F0